MIPSRKHLLLINASRLSSGQRATLSKLKAAMAAAAVSNPEDDAIYSGSAFSISMTNAADGTLTNAYTYTSHGDKIYFGPGTPVKSDGSVNNADNWALRQSSPDPANGNLNGLGFGANKWSQFGAETEFETNAPTLEVRLASLGEGSGNTKKVRCIFDNKFLDKTGHSLFAATSWFKVTGLPNDGNYRPVVLLHNHLLHSVRVAPGYSIRARQTPLLQGLIEGDSYGEPQSIRNESAINPNAQFGADKIMARRLGWGACQNAAVGLTGYYNDGGTRRTIPNRIADWKSLRQFDWIKCRAGFNDGTQYVTTAANAVASWTDIRAAQPNALIIIEGVPTSANLAVKQAIEENIKANAYDLWNDPFKIWIPICTDPLDAWTDCALDGDGSHWSNAGHATAGSRSADRVRVAVNALR